jgi:putative flippase GtrA
MANLTLPTWKSPLVADPITRVHRKKDLMSPRAFAALRFAILGAFSFSLNFGLTVLLHEVVGIREEFAFAFALALTTVMNFFAMRLFVYPGREGRILAQFGLFVVSSLSFRSLEYALFLVFHTWIGLPYKLVLVATLVTTFVTKFFYYGAVVFARLDREADTAASKTSESVSAAG